MKQGLDTYTKACIEAKGKRIRVGPPCLYLTNALCQSIATHSKVEGVEDFKKAVLAIVFKEKVLNYEEYFTFCRVCTLKTAKHVNYLSIRIEPEHALIKNFIYKTLLSEGKKTVGGPPPTPALKNLKDKLISRGQWGGEKGKGKGKDNK